MDDLQRLSRAIQVHYDEQYMTKIKELLTNGDKKNILVDTQAAVELCTAFQRQLASTLHEQVIQQQDLQGYVHRYISHTVGIDKANEPIRCHELNEPTFQRALSLGITPPQHYYPIALFIHRFCAMMPILGMGIEVQPHLSVELMNDVEVLCLDFLSWLVRAQTQHHTNYNHPPQPTPSEPIAERTVMGGSFVPTPQQPSSTTTTQTPHSFTTPPPILLTRPELYEYNLDYDLMAADYPYYIRFGADDVYIQNNIYNFHPNSHHHPSAPTFQRFLQLLMQYQANSTIIKTVLIVLCDSIEWELENNTLPHFTVYHALIQALATLPHTPTQHQIDVYAALPHAMFRPHPPYKQDQQGRCAWIFTLIWILASGFRVGAVFDQDPPDANWRGLVARDGVKNDDAMDQILMNNGIGTYPQLLVHLRLATLTSDGLIGIDQFCTRKVKCLEKMVVLACEDGGEIVENVGQKIMDQIPSGHNGQQIVSTTTTTTTTKPTTPPPTPPRPTSIKMPKVNPFDPNTLPYPIPSSFPTILSQIVITMSFFHTKKYSTKLVSFHTLGQLLQSRLEFAKKMLHRNEVAVMDSEVTTMRFLWTHRYYETTTTPTDKATGPDKGLSKVNVGLNKGLNKRTGAKNGLKNNDDGAGNGQFLNHDDGDELINLNPMKLLQLHTSIARTEANGIIWLKMISHEQSKAYFGPKGTAGRNPALDMDPESLKSNQQALVRHRIITRIYNHLKYGPNGSFPVDGITYGPNNPKPSPNQPPEPHSWNEPLRYMTMPLFDAPFNLCGQLVEHSKYQIIGNHLDPLLPPHLEILLSYLDDLDRKYQRNVITIGAGEYGKRKALGGSMAELNQLANQFGLPPLQSTLRPFELEAAIKIMAQIMTDADFSRDLLVETGCIPSSVKNPFSSSSLSSLLLPTPSPAPTSTPINNNVARFGDGYNPLDHFDVNDRLSMTPVITSFITFLVRFGFNPPPHTLESTFRLQRTLCGADWVEEQISALSSPSSTSTTTTKPPTTTMKTSSPPSKYHPIHQNSFRLKSSTLFTTHNQALSITPRASKMIDSWLIVPAIDSRDPITILKTLNLLPITMIFPLALISTPIRASDSRNVLDHTVGMFQLDNNDFTTDPKGVFLRVLRTYHLPTIAMVIQLFPNIFPRINAVNDEYAPLPEVIQWWVSVLPLFDPPKSPPPPPSTTTTKSGASTSQLSALFTSQLFPIVVQELKKIKTWLIENLIDVKIAQVCIKTAKRMKCDIGTPVMFYSSALMSRPLVFNFCEELFSGKMTIEMMLEYLTLKEMEVDGQKGKEKDNNKSKSAAKTTAKTSTTTTKTATTSKSGSKSKKTTTPSSKPDPQSSSTSSNPVKTVSIYSNDTIPDQNWLSAKGNSINTLVNRIAKISNFMADFDQLLQDAISSAPKGAIDHNGNLGGDGSGSSSSTSLVSTSTAIVPPAGSRSSASSSSPPVPASSMSTSSTSPHPLSTLPLQTLFHAILFAIGDEMCQKLHSFDFAEQEDAARWRDYQKSLADNPNALTILLPTNPNANEKDTTNGVDQATKGKIDPKKNNNHSKTNKGKKGATSNPPLPPPPPPSPENPPAPTYHKLTYIEFCDFCDYDEQFGRGAGGGVDGGDGGGGGGGGGGIGGDHNLSPPALHFALRHLLPPSLHPPHTPIPKYLPHLACDPAEIESFHSSLSARTILGLMDRALFDHDDDDDGDGLLSPSGSDSDSSLWPPSGSSDGSDYDEDDDELGSFEDDCIYDGPGGAHGGFMTWTNPQQPHQQRQPSKHHQQRHQSLHNDPNQPVSVTNPDQLRYHSGHNDANHSESSFHSIPCSESRSDNNSGTEFQLDGFDDEDYDDDDEDYDSHEDDSIIINPSSTRTGFPDVYNTPINGSNNTNRSALGGLLNGLSPGANLTKTNASTSFPNNTNNPNPHKINQSTTNNTTNNNANNNTNNTASPTTFPHNSNPSKMPMIKTTYTMAPPNGRFVGPQPQSMSQQQKQQYQQQPPQNHGK